MGPTTTWTSIMLSNRLVEEDRAHFIHPVTPLRAHERRGVTVLESADGCFITDATGHRLLDGFAGLWCVNTGYGRESIVTAAMEQMRRPALRHRLFPFRQ
jgi:putrescine aminotransferase